MRQGIEDLHEQVDAAISGLELDRRDGYGRFLLVSDRVVPRFEAALEAAGIERLLPDWPERRRARALAHDLALLGLPRAPSAPPPDLRDPDAQLGAAYALEGARNGAVLLVRRPRCSSDPLVRQATAFLGHGAGGGLWRSFIERLERRPREEPAVQRALVGARAVFEAYLVALAERPRAAA